MASPPASDAVVHEFVDRLNDHDWEGVSALLDDEFTVTMGSQRYGTEPFLDSEAAFVAAFPDLTYAIEQCFSAGERVAFRWTFTGTHEGTGGPGVLVDVEPTGETVEGPGIQLARVVDGRIETLWAEWSGLSLYDQLGVVEFVTE